MHRSRRAQGFTLIELFVAMAVLLIGSIGALVGILNASKDLRDGQLRVLANVLLEARLQRSRLQDKLALFNQGNATGSYTSPGVENTGLGDAPWKMDDDLPSGGDSNDLGYGALFSVLPDGTIVRPTLASTPTSCASSAIPKGVYCREVVVTRGAPVSSPGDIIASSAQVATLWVRVSRIGDPIGLAVVTREVIAL